MDCGLYQEGDIATNYKVNLELLNKLHVKEVDYIILSHNHGDHSCLVPALYARGCQAHLIVPKGSTPFLKLLWEDSMKIMVQDCQKLSSKGVKAAPFYTQEDIDVALNRIIEVDRKGPYHLTPNIVLHYCPANHIINACQIHLEFIDGYVSHKLAYTGDIGGELPQHYVKARETLPYANVLLSECTYNQPGRENKAYDRDKDIQKIEAVVRDSHRVLIPCFSLGRTQTMLTLLYEMWCDGKLPHDIKVVLDSPLAQHICNVWPMEAPWSDVMAWNNLHMVESWEESQMLMEGRQSMVVLSASGFLTGGRVMEWLKYILPDSRNTILFCGYSGANNLASKIRFGDKIVNVNGSEVNNKANIIELVSFSSHANYKELKNYLTNACRCDKLILVHGDARYKPDFAKVLQRELVDQGKSTRVLCGSPEQRVFF